MKSQGVWRGWNGKFFALASFAALLAALGAGPGGVVRAAAEEEPETDAGRAPASDDSDSEYNFSWLDPDKKIYVLQNRKYTKAGSPMLSAMVGLGLSNSYRNTYNVDVRAGYHLSEDWGLEGFYSLSSNSANTTFRALAELGRNNNLSVLPVMREITSQLGGLAHWSPWYAKINVFNQILYFDWYFTAGAGMIHAQLDTRKNPNQASVFVKEDYIAGFLGTGHQYHLSKMWAVRLDFMGGFYRAAFDGASGAKTWFSNFNFNAGITCRL